MSVHIRPQSCSFLTSFSSIFTLLHTCNKVCSMSCSISLACIFNVSPCTSQHATPGASSLPHAGIYYSPQPTPTPHQWSAPINTHSAGYVAPLQQRGYVIQPQAPAAAPLMIQPSRVVSELTMLACRIEKLIAIREWNVYLCL